MLLFMLHPMHEMQTIAIGDSVHLSHSFTVQTLLNGSKFGLGWSL